ncbi:hypothetical protein HDV06_002887 [Boothiomyces sp. JEL0866]|nr:hypothetical protein HDV06_002887 [Boothiomyces sp. JEL0866]
MSKLSQSVKDYLKELVSKLKADKDLGELDTVDVNDPKSIQKILDKYQAQGLSMPAAFIKH